MKLYIRRRDCESPKCFRIFLGFLRIICNLNYLSFCFLLRSKELLACYQSADQMPHNLVMELLDIQDCRADIVRAAKIKILAPQKLSKDCLLDILVKYWSSEDQLTQSNPFCTSVITSNQITRAYYDKSLL